MSLCTANCLKTMYAYFTIPLYPWRRLEVYIPNTWILDNPWGHSYLSVSPQTLQSDIPSYSSLQTFPIRRLIHATHKLQAESIVKANMFIPKPLTSSPGYTYKLTLDPDPRVTTYPLPIHGEILPDQYVWFTIAVDLTLEQKDACRRILGLPLDAKGKGFRYRQPLKLADYIENHSRYGNYAFQIDLPTVIENYRHSRRHFGSDKFPDVYLKNGGTKRYKNTATYTIIVCAVHHSDPLPQLPNLDQYEIRKQSVFDPKGFLDRNGRVRCNAFGNVTRDSIPEFHPKAITVGQLDNETQQWIYHDWDQVDFAFHFPKEVLDKKHSIPGGDVTVKGLYCGVHPQRVHHTFCVPLKRNVIESCEEVQGSLHDDFDSIPLHLADRLC